MELPIELKKETNTVVSDQAAKPKFCKSKKATENGSAYATGKRKNAVARVWIKPGTGKFLVNKKEVDHYFPRDYHVKLITQPFSVTNTLGQYDVVCTAKGGGISGQAGAIRHGIAKALDCVSDSFHIPLKSEGLLTRDPRVVERKKYGLRKARKSTQFSKR